MNVIHELSEFRAPFSRKQKEMLHGLKICVPPQYIYRISSIYLLGELIDSQNFWRGAISSNGAYQILSKFTIHHFQLSFKFYL